MLLKQIIKLPIGYSEVTYMKRTYSATRNDFNNGKSFKVFAQELGGNDFISLNYYVTKKSESLKPCEMTQQKVIDFLNGYQQL